MNELLAYLILFWPYLLGAFALVVLAVLLLRPRRRRIELTQEDDRAARRTLERAPPPPPPPLPAAPVESDLTRLKGLGPRIAAALQAQGIETIAELAALDDVALARVDAGLGPMAGRLARDRLHEQARLLAAREFEAYEARFGRLGDLPR